MNKKKFAIELLKFAKHSVVRMAVHLQGYLSGTAHAAKDTNPEGEGDLDTNITAIHSPTLPQSSL